MCRLSVFSALAISLLCFSPILKAAPQNSNQDSPAPSVSGATYPNSPDGLKQFITDIFAAMESGDNDKASALLSTLEIPDHNAWFTNNFGPAEGPRLDAEYTVLAGKPDTIRGHFKYALADGRTEPTVEEVADHNSELDRAITDAMAQPFPIYSVKGSSPKEQFPVFIGYFYYADAGFRFIDPNVFQALSTAPPMPIRVGGPVEAARLIHKVAPVYPLEARVKGVQGTVVLHAIIGKDGKIEDLQPVSGDPLLIPAAIDAIAKWEYQPTLVDGMPVKTETTITAYFQLGR
jgi:TonB family protein